MLHNQIRWLLGLTQQVRLACRVPNTQKRLIRRVAARKIIADLRTELDQQARLQVLLGALDYGNDEIRSGHWARGRAGEHLKVLKEEMQDNPIDPKFFSLTNVGVFDIPHQVVMRDLRSNGLDESQADDILQILMSGLKKSGGERRMSFVEIGRYFKDRILNGGLKASQVAAIASRHAKNAVATYLKTYFKRINPPRPPDGPANLFRSEHQNPYSRPSTMEEPGFGKWQEQEIPPEAVMPHRDRLDTFVELFKESQTEPLGKLVAAYARNQLASLSEAERSHRPKDKESQEKPTGGEMAAYFLLQLADKGRTPSFVELGKRYGLSDQGAKKKIERALQYVAKRLAKDPSAKVPQTGQNLMDAMEWAAIRDKMTGRRS